MYAAVAEEEYEVRSESAVPGAGTGTLDVISTTVHSSEIQMKSSGNCIFFIPKLPAGPESYKKSMPVCSGMLSRLDRPLARSTGVLANSTRNVASPISTLGPFPAGGSAVDGRCAWDINGPVPSSVREPPQPAITKQTIVRFAAQIDMSFNGPSHEFDDRSAVAAFLGFLGGEGLRQGVPLQQLSHRTT